jgi:hypothetical protein
MYFVQKTGPGLHQTGMSGTLRRSALRSIGAFKRLDLNQASDIVVRCRSYSEARRYVAPGGSSIARLVSSLDSKPSRS